jgi:hypothetical protein
MTSDTPEAIELMLQIFYTYLTFVENYPSKGSAFIPLAVATTIMAASSFYINRGNLDPRLGLWGQTL